jgi:hypothetical protein
MRRRWRHSRGAALVETCVLAPILILMWIGIDYFRASYARRLRTLSVAYGRAWTRAFARDGSCQRGSTPDSVHALLDGAVSGDERAQVRGAIDVYVASRPAWAFRGGYVDERVTLATDGARWGGGAGVTVTGGAFLPCNEMVPVPDRDVESAVGSYLAKVFGP